MIEKEDHGIEKTASSPFKWPQNADLLENIISHSREKYDISQELQDKLKSVGIYRDITEKRIDTGLEDNAKMEDFAMEADRRLEDVAKIEDTAKITDTRKEDAATITNTELKDIAKITGQNMIIKNWMKKKPKKSKKQKKTEIGLNKYKEIDTTKILNRITVISWRDQEKNVNIIQSR